MKRILILLTIITFGFSAFAQEATDNTSENPYLPKAGDIAVGIDGSPIFSFIGNMFNGTQNNSLNLGDNTLYFRYYLKDDAAVRFKLRINSDKNVNKYYVQDDAALFNNPLSQAKVEDRFTSNINSHEFSIGYQMFRNYKRLRGFYGADLGFGIFSAKEKYEYGNQMTELNPSPTTHWGSLPVRTLEEKYSRSKSIYAGVFAGAEYYFMPQVCIGAEFGLSYGMTFSGQGSRMQERMVISQHVEEDIEITPGNSNIDLHTRFPYSFGNLYFMIHF